MSEQPSSKERFPNPEDDLFSDAMDAAATAFHSSRYGILKNAERAGETPDGERVVRVAIAAAFNAYVGELRPTPEPNAAHLHCDNCDSPSCAGLPATAHPPGEPSPEWILRARAEGRAEFLDLLQSQSAETFLNDYARDSPNGEAGDYSTNWDQSELRKLFKVDEAAYSLIDNISAAYWSQEMRIQELETRAAQPPSGSRTCAWVPIEHGSSTYNTCVDGEEFCLNEGLELWPHCHLCGGRIEVVDPEDEEDWPRDAPTKEGEHG